MFPPWEGCRVSVLVLVILFQPLIATYRPLNGTLETTHPSKLIALASHNIHLQVELCFSLN